MMIQIRGKLSNKTRERDLLTQKATMHVKYNFSSSMHMTHTHTHTYTHAHTHTQMKLKCESVDPLCRLFIGNFVGRLSFCSNIDSKSLKFKHHRNIILLLFFISERIWDTYKKKIIIISERSGFVNKYKK